MAAYWTAAEERVVLPNRPLGAGRLYGDSQTAPVGRCHAVTGRGTETVCGLPVDDLHCFESTPFNRPSIQRCPDCVDRLRVAG
jgi:hypothetical protein